MSLRAWIAASRLVSRGLHAADLDPDPYAQFYQWFKRAGRIGLPMPNAMTLTTCNEMGQPSARTVLLKEFGIHEGFVFYTNYGSRKARELEANPNCCLLLHWHIIQRQIRIEGRVERCDYTQSDRYFQTRPRGSRLSAWASRQSEPVGSEEEMQSRYDEVVERYKDGPVPCPEFWGGYRVIPHTLEFWQGRAFRFHDRYVYTREDVTTNNWQIQRHYP